MGKVIVVGGGGAGLIAAISAREAGAEVLLLSKAPAGLANCTAYAGGGFTLGIDGVTPERHRQATLETGRYLNEDHLLDVMAREAPLKVPELARHGVKMDIRPGSVSVARYASNAFYGGMALTRPLLAEARRLGVEIRNHFFASRLLLRDGMVYGVAGLDWKKAGRRAAIAPASQPTNAPVSGTEEEEIPAGAVILATGGAGRLYRRTDNPIRTTGDGYLLAWQAGAQLQDMEFVQFYPLGFAEPGFPIWFISLRSIDVAPLTNAAGERFLEPLLVQWGIKNGREANLFARDRAAVAIARERRQGDVYLHLEKVPPENWQDQDLKGLLPLFPAWFPRREKPVRVAPVQHYFAGGVTIDTDGWTGVPGLFACGEVTGGVDGANRVGGNALSNLTVFGLRAGRAAAECAQGAARGWPQSHLAAGETYPPKDGGSRAERASKPAGTPVREAGPFDSGGVFAGAALPELDPTSLVKRWLSRRDGTSPQELRDKINDLAERCLGPLRDEAGLREAQRELSELWRLLGETSLHGSEDLLLALENRSLLFTAQLVAEAAWQREESRGVHYREDFPAERTQWQRHITLRGNRGRLQWGRKPV